MEKDIDARMKKITTVINTLSNKENITPEEVIMLNQIIEELSNQIEEIQDIKKTYEEDDRELIGTMKSAK